MMNHRERELATFRREIPDRIPVDAIVIENTAAVAMHLGIAEGDVISHLGLDGRLVEIGYASEARESDLDQSRDEWGALGGTEYGTTHAYPLAGERNVANMERYVWPDPAHYDYASAAASAADQSTEYAVRGPYWQPLFCSVCSLVGMETALVWMITDPGLFEATLDAVFERTFALCEEYIHQCNSHLDILCLGDDFASQRGMLLSRPLALPSSNNLA